MVMRLGLIAEDASDVQVLTILAKKITNKSISVSHFVGKGCGPLARKTPAWCRALWQKGCTRVILVHDQDRNDPTQLRSKLEEILVSAPQNKATVVIPTEELEAWLLSDMAAIARVMKLTKAIAEVHHPERISSPKEHIGAVVWRTSGKQKTYVNTVHNPLIADQMDLGKITIKCPSFSVFVNALR
jgi:hypothetical protein